MRRDAVVKAMVSKKTKEEASNLQPPYRQYPQIQVSLSLMTFRAEFLTASMQQSRPTPSRSMADKSLLMSFC